jgi:hypothetical protein
MVFLTILGYIAMMVIGTIAVYLIGSAIVGALSLKLGPVFLIVGMVIVYLVATAFDLYWLIKLIKFVWGLLS